MIDFTVGREGRSITRFAIPLIVGHFVTQLYNVVDGIIVGQYVGDNALAAVGASFPIIFLLNALVIGLCNGGTIVVAQFFGAKDQKNILRSICTINIFLLLSAILVAIVGITFSNDIFKFIKLPTEIIPDANSYINIYLAGSIGIFFYHGISAILRGIGDSTTPLYCLIASSLANLFLDLLFVAYLNLGIEGAAWATIISQGISAIGLAIYLNHRSEFFKFNLENIKFHRDIFRTISRIGLPSGLQQTFMALGNMAMLGIVNGFGAATITAYTIVGRIELLSTVPATAFSAAIATFVGHNIGAHRLDRIQKGVRSIGIITTIIALIIGLATIIFHQNILTAFTDDSEIIEIGSVYLITIGIFYFANYLMFVAMGVFRGAGDTFVHMVISLFSLCIVRLAFAYIFSNQIGVSGIWNSIPLSWLVGMIISGFYYQSGHWKKRAII